MFYVYAELRICFDSPDADSVDDLYIYLYENYPDHEIGERAHCTELDNYDCTWCYLDFYDTNNDELAHNHGITLHSEDDGYVQEIWFSTHVYAATPSYKLPPQCLIYR